MKPPRSYHPTFVLLSGLAFAAIVFGVGLVSNLPPPFGRPLSLWGVGAGFLLGLLRVGIEALVERSGGDEFLRRRLLRREVYWSGRYWWLRMVWWVLALPLAQWLGPLWVLSGLSLGVAAPYPYWKAHWQRLQRVAQEETVAAESTTG
ncbi:MAG: hypothetical protein ABFD96_00515 [Armatimonadia bacterium]